MPFWLLALLLWLTPSCLLVLYALSRLAYAHWHDALNDKATRRADAKWAARHGIDLHTTRAGFLGGRR